jgi:hypothetical protein
MDEKKAPGPKAEGKDPVSGEERGVVYVYVPGKKYPVPAASWVRASSPGRIVG